MATKALIITAAIDAFENIIVKTIHIVSAFLHATNDEKILLKFRGKIVELLVQLEPSMYRKYVT